MSNPEESQRTPPASETFGGLESAVRRLIRRSAGLRAELDAAQARNRELMGLLAPEAAGEGAAEGGADGGAEGGAEGLLERLRVAEADRQQLRERIVRGREVAKRMMARIRFLEDRDG